MRLFLLPISTRRSLIYCQRLNIQLTSQETYVEKVTARAGATWVKWESADSGWQKKLTGWGNELFKRIPFEEWGLKSIPPLSTRRPAEDVPGQEETDVIYPPSVIKPGTVFDVLQKLATERQSLHRKRMWGSIAGMPVTIPFGLIPILPNIPFFYLVWRAWSHWRAFSGSKHVEHLLQEGLIKSAPSDLLSRIYSLQANKSFGSQFYPDYCAFLREWKTVEESQKDEEKDIVNAMATLSSNVHELVKEMDELLQPPESGLNVSTPTDNAPPPPPNSKPDTNPQPTSTESHIQTLTTSSQTLKHRLSALNLRTTPPIPPPTPDSAEEMLLTPGSGKLLADALQLHELEAEIERAVAQVQQSLAAETEQREQKAKLDTAARVGGKGSGEKE
ncbi:hypothetical protein MMC26_005640 [Xylographa opegraphella]|nr:hypothetical protein [Xylographa opegraphella]